MQHVYIYVGEKWEMFGEAVLACEREVSNMWKVGDKHVRKGSEWWVDEVKLLVNKKAEAHGHHLKGGGVQVIGKCTRESDRRLRG